MTTQTTATRARAVLAELDSTTAALCAGHLSASDFDAQQRHLWAVAEQHGLTSAVLALWRKRWAL